MSVATLSGTPDFVELSKAYRALAEEMNANIKPFHDRLKTSRDTAIRRPSKMFQSAVTNKEDAWKVRQHVATAITGNSETILSKLNAYQAELQSKQWIRDIVASFPDRSQVIEAWCLASQKAGESQIREAITNLVIAKRMLEPGVGTLSITDLKTVITAEVGDRIRAATQEREKAMGSLATVMSGEKIPNTRPDFLTWLNSSNAALAVDSLAESIARQELQNKRKEGKAAKRARQKASKVSAKEGVPTQSKAAVVLDHPKANECCEELMAEEVPPRSVTEDITQFKLVYPQGDTDPPTRRYMLHRRNADDGLEIPYGLIPVFSDGHGVCDLDPSSAELTVEPYQSHPGMDHALALHRLGWAISNCRSYIEIQKSTDIDENFSVDPQGNTLIPDLQKRCNTARSLLDEFSKWSKTPEGLKKTHRQGSGENEDENTQLSTLEDLAKTYTLPEQQKLIKDWRATAIANRDRMAAMAARTALDAERAWTVFDDAESYDRMKEAISQLSMTVERSANEYHSQYDRLQRRWAALSIGTKVPRTLAELASHLSAKGQRETMTHDRGKQIEEARIQ